MSLQTSQSEHNNKKMGELPQRIITITQAFETYLYAPLYLAKDLGYFRDEGIEVNILTTNGDDTAFDMLLSNRAQFAIGDPAFVALSPERERQGQVLLPILNGAPFFGVTKNPNIDFIVQTKNLSGLKIATFPAPSTSFALQKQMFQKAGLVGEIIEVPFGTSIEALESGKADIALMIEPEVSLAVERGYRIVYSLGDIYPDFVITALTARFEYIEQHTDITDGVVKAIVKAISYIYEHGAVQTAKLLQKRFPEVTLNIGEKVIRDAINKKTFARDKKINKLGWSSVLKLRLDTGSVDNIVLNQRYAERAFIIGVNAQDIQKQFLFGGVNFSVLSGISVHTRAGDILAILGKSGQGKSTFLNILSGLEQLTSGKIFSRGSIGYVFQDPKFLPWRTILQNVLLPLEIQKTITSEAINNSLFELDEMGLSAFVDYFPHQLSGGMKQKVSLVRTMIQDPDIILFDEPFSAVDYAERVLLIKRLREFIVSKKKIALFVTHNIEEALAIADRIVVFDEKPTTIVYKTDINIPNEYRDPVNVRKSKDFQELFEQIWKLMSKQI